MPYFLAPYELVRKPPGHQVRANVLAGVLPPEVPGQLQPYWEAEGLGGYAVCLILDDALAQAAAAVPGVLALPELGLTERLGAVSASTRKELRDALDAQGYTLAQVREAIGDDLAQASLLGLLQLMVSTRRSPRLDENGETLLDGPPAPTIPVPLAPIAGGAFPTTAILDDFTRANVGPPPSASWDGVFNSAKNFKVLSNAMVPNAAPSNGAWATAFAANQELYITLTTWNAAGTNILLYNRLPALNAANVSGYELEILQPSGTMEWYRRDAGAFTFMSPAITQVFANGDAVGVESIGTSHKVYRKPAAGAWGAALATRTDATYNATSYIGVYTNNASTVLDNFGGGAIGGAVSDAYPPARAMRTLLVR